jgi:DNA polymerase delta subunit 3
MEDVPAPEEKDSQEVAPPKEPSPEPGSEAAVTSQGGRRRGRRKVMKKVRGKDEDGYMGTFPSICVERVYI